VPTIDFQIIGAHMDKSIPRSSAEEVSENLEEIHTNVWPPASGPLRFFV